MLDEQSMSTFAWHVAQRIYLLGSRDTTQTTYEICNCTLANLIRRLQGCTASAGAFAYRRLRRGCGDAGSAQTKSRVWESEGQPWIDIFLVAYIRRFELEMCCHVNFGSLHATAVYAVRSVRQAWPRSCPCAGLKRYWLVSLPRPYGTDPEVVAYH